MGTCCSQSQNRHQIIHHIDSNALIKAIDHQKLTQSSQLLSESPIFQRALSSPAILNYRPYVFPSQTFLRLQSCPIPQNTRFPQLYRSEDRFSRKMKREKLISLLEESLKDADSRIMKSKNFIRNYEPKYDNNINYYNNKEKNRSKINEIIEEIADENNEENFILVENPRCSEKNNLDELKQNYKLNEMFMNEKSTNYMNNFAQNNEDIGKYEENHDDTYKKSNGDSLLKEEKDFGDSTDNKLNISFDNTNKKTYNDNNLSPKKNLSNNENNTKLVNFDKKQDNTSNLTYNLDKNLQNIHLKDLEPNQYPQNPKITIQNSTNSNIEKQNLNIEKQNLKKDFEQNPMNSSKNYPNNQFIPKDPNLSNKKATRPNSSNNPPKDLIQKSLLKEINKRTPLKDNSYKKFEKQIIEELKNLKSIEEQKPQQISFSSSKETPTKPSKASSRKSGTPTKSLNNKTPFKDPSKLISELKSSPYQSHVKTLHLAINNFMKGSNLSTKTGGLSQSQHKNRLTPERVRPLFNEISQLYSYEKERQSSENLKKIKNLTNKTSNFYPDYLSKTEKKTINKANQKNLTEKKNYIDEIYDLKLNDRIFDEISQENLAKYKGNSSSKVPKTLNSSSNDSKSLQELKNADNLYFNKHIYCPYVTCEPAQTKGVSIYDIILKNLKSFKKKL